MGGKAYIRTFGCQMNVKDSERMEGLLREAGYEPTSDPGEADILMVNTCTVREKPEAKMFGVTGRWKRLKEENPAVVIGVAGCVAQQHGARLLDKVPHLDLVIGTQMIHRLPELVERAKAGERISAIDWLEPGAPELFCVPAAAPRETPTAFVSIMQGCDNACAYCVVPSVRGKASSRDPESIIGEVADLAGQGVMEVTLLGQNVNAYGAGGVDFPGLLGMAAEVPGILRVRFTTSHPKDLDDRTIEAMASHPNIMEHIHLPVQAGADPVLNAMNRGYTRAHYLALVEKLKEAMPDVGITTDLIVGFPGETDEDFEQTLALLREVRYDETFSFRYSPRPGTAAAGLAGQLAEEEKYERLYRLQDLQRGITEEKNREQVGRTHQVLIEGASKTDPEKFSGRTRTNRIVHFPREDVVPGDLVEVRITRALKHSLEGEIMSPREAAVATAKEEPCLWR